MQLVFGIYPGGAAGGDSGLLAGLADDAKRIIGCLDELQGQSQPFVVRCYDSFQDPGSPLATSPCAPVGYAQYAIAKSRPLDLVLQFRSAAGDVGGYLEFIRQRISEHHRLLYSVQITEEPNFTDGPNVIDGPYPNVRRAVVEGVTAAKEALRGLGHPHVKVGFNSTPTFGPSAEFWSGLGGLRDERFAAALDYVGLDFFPDVFRPVKPDELSKAVTGILETMRQNWLPAAGIAGHVPIHITEHGWPTGPARSAARQAEVLGTVIRTIDELRERLNIQRYTLFSLRDVDHANAGDENNLFRFFGVTTADYQRKPAFETFRSFVQAI